MPSTQLTILNNMAGADFEQSLRQHVEWGLHWLDLKDSIFGKGIIDLSEDEAQRAADLIGKHGLEVCCLSTVLFDDDIEKGQAAFAAGVAAKPAHAAKLARILKAKKVRLIAARSSRRDQIADMCRHLDDVHPWLVPLYASAIDTIAASGTEVTIENEAHGCILASVPDILGLFDRLKKATSTKVTFTWDVQNFWQMGQFPSLQIYGAIKSLVGYYHVKGGIATVPQGPLVYRSSLEDASWPVTQITRQVIDDGISPVICLNPPHGKPKDGYDYTALTRRDLAFMRRHFPEIH